VGGHRPGDQWALGCPLHQLVDVPIDEGDPRALDEGDPRALDEGDPRALDKVDDGVGHQDLTRRRKRHRGRDRAHGESNLLRHGQQNLEHSGRAPPAILPEQVPRLRKAREENLQVGDTWHVEGNLTGLEAAAGLPPTPSSPSHTYDGEPF